MPRSSLPCRLVAAWLIVGSPAMATAPDCRSPATQLDMNLCEGEAYDQVDARLNRSYAKLVKALEPERVEALRAAQRAWVTFRERECAFAGSEAEGGSMQPMLIAGCARVLTEQRIKSLEGYLR